MQITRQSEYAIKTLLELARIPFGQTMPTGEIAEEQDIPEVFLKKTIQMLVRGGLVATQRGAQGGVRLSVSAEQVTIMDIIEAVEGPLAINPCLTKGNHCQNESLCQLRPVLERAQSALKKELSRETLQEILDNSRRAASRS